MIDFHLLVIPSLILGLLIGGISRLGPLKPISIILSSGCVFTIFVLVDNFLNYVQNPAINNLHVFIASVIPFVIVYAFMVRGAEAVQNFPRH